MPGEPSKRSRQPGMRGATLADAEAGRGVPVDPGRGPDDDGRLKDDRRSRAEVVHRLGARDRLRGMTGLPMDELSMGMSNDFETAIEEGATLVRVGSALFEGVEP